MEPELRAIWIAGWNPVPEPAKVTNIRGNLNSLIIYIPVNILQHIYVHLQGNLNRQRHQHRLHPVLNLLKCSPTRWRNLSYFVIIPIRHINIVLSIYSNAWRIIEFCICTNSINITLGWTLKCLPHLLSNFFLIFDYFDPLQNIFPASRTIPARLANLATSAAPSCKPEVEPAKVDTSVSSVPTNQFKFNPVLQSHLYLLFSCTCYSLYFGHPTCDW
jgi:hypothetical protein